MAGDTTGVNIKLTPKQMGVVMGGILTYTTAAIIWLTSLHSDVAVLKVEVAEVKQGITELKTRCSISNRVTLATKGD